MIFPKSKIGKRTGIQVLAALAAFAAFAANPIYAGITVKQDAEPYAFTYRTYVDFGATTTDPNHLTYAYFNTSEHPRGQAVKYFEVSINGSSPSAAQGSCLEIETAEATPGTVADTEILVSVPNPANANTKIWKRLSDDYSGTRFSRARIYMPEGYVDPTPVFVRVAAYGVSFNATDFYVKTKLVRQANANDPITTQAECFSAPGVATAWVDRHENVAILTTN